MNNHHNKGVSMNRNTVAICLTAIIVAALVALPVIAGGGSDNSPGACCFVDQSCQLLFAHECLGQGGTWLGNAKGFSCANYSCDCPLDFDHDGEVGIIDFLAVLENWGPCQ